jgi:hypothetical protein
MPASHIAHRGVAGDDGVDRQERDFHGASAARVATYDDAMDALLEAQLLALGAMQRACARRPGLHAHQLHALERERAICAAAPTVRDYQRAAGGGFELVRAAWLDRVAGSLRASLAVGDRHAACAALAQYRGALAAQDLSGWTAALTAAAHAAAPWRERSARAGSNLTRTVMNLLLHHSCTPPLADHWGDAVSAWRLLCEADPFAARELRFAAAWPARVEPRLPWRDGPARAWLQRLLAPLPAPLAADFDHDDDGASADENAEAGLAAQLSHLSRGWQLSLRHEAASRQPTAAADDAPWVAAMKSTDQALAPWRQMAEPATGAAPAALAIAGVAQRLLVLAAGAGSGPAVHRCAIESGLLTELAAAPLHVRLAEIEHRQLEWPQALLAAHARGLRATLPQAGTATEVELLWTHAHACFDIEADWQSLFFAAQLAPLRAALNFAISAAEAGRGLLGATAISRGLLGQAPAAALQGRLVQAVVHDHLAEGAPDPGNDAVAWLGEDGHGLRPLVRAWQAVAATRGEKVPRDRIGLLAALQQLGGRCLDGTSAVDPVRVQLWGVSSDARQATQLLAAPSRPALPLWQGTGDGGDAV